MSRNTQLLKTELREKLGSRNARKLRAGGRIPASLDKDGTHPHVDFHIEEHAFLAARRKHAHVYELEFGGQKEHVLVQRLQWDTFGESVIHIEFRRVRLDVKTEVDVELEFRGHPKGALLNHLVTHVKIRAIPTQIPDEIEVPVGHLTVGGSIYARELVMPEGVELASSPDLKIAVAVLAKVEEVAPTPAAATAEPVAAATPAAATTPPAKG
ncbi:MAG: 50S ribosomal protein L25 [Planctomycetota bacterium]